MPVPDKNANASRERIRLLYSLGDFQLALSATAFLAECNADGKYSKIELRRFRCYETTAIIAYTRPFSQSQGTMPRLSLKMTGANLNAEQTALHNELINLRNKVVAHSDEEMMRMVSKAHPIEIGPDSKFVFVETVYDEGLTFVGEKLFELDGLLRSVRAATFAKLFKDVQKTPSDFNIQKDYISNSI